MAAFLLAGCGGGGGGDSGGFSGSERKAAQSILASLSQTVIPSTLTTLTYNAGTLQPTECEVHPVAGATDAFELFIYWKPRSNPDNTAPEYYAWFNATIGAEVRSDTFHVSYSNARISSTSVVEILREHLPADFFTKPLEKCTMASDGSVALVGTS